MNKINRIVLIAILGLGTFSISAAEIESNFALSNDYIWRGMTQTDEGFAYSGGVDAVSYTHLTLPTNREV